jgi:hypothetical protein
MQELMFDVGFKVRREYPDFNARHPDALHARNFFFVGRVGGANLNEENGLLLGIEEDDVGPKKQGFFVGSLVKFQLIS